MLRLTLGLKSVMLTLKCTKVHFSPILEKLFYYKSAFCPNIQPFTWIKCHFGHYNYTQFQDKATGNFAKNSWCHKKIFVYKHEWSLYTKLIRFCIRKIKKVWDVILELLWIADNRYHRNVVVWIYVLFHSELHTEGWGEVVFNGGANLVAKLFHLIERTRHVIV